MQDCAVCTFISCNILFHTETPNLFNVVLLFIPAVSAEALSGIQVPLRAFVYINKAGIPMVTGQGAIEVNVNINNDKTVTGSFSFWPLRDLLSHL